ncbi:MAG: alkyl hydroperoxide reductase [Elusimicrobia bacterium RBG_16_66_12]|nr:MAG: alkyl hydroperoxide reductase [Elusimicrobia bacterium RBG_16_66_12]
MQLGDKAPAFSLMGVDGKTHTLESVKGAKATIVVFSCNHCPYVIMNEDRLISAFTDYKAKGVGMAAISSNDAAKYPDDSFEEMKKRAKEKGFPFPYLHDESQEVARAYGATHTPHLFVFDRDLRLAYTGAVDDDNNYRTRKKVERPYLRDALDDLVAGRPVRVPETHAIGCTIKWK